MTFKKLNMIEALLKDLKVCDSSIPDKRRKSISFGMPFQKFFTSAKK